LPPGPHALYAYQPAWACRTYRGTAGGGCATLLAVLLNDKADPLGFGARRKKVDEVYGFGATPVFHNAEPETPNEYGCGQHGAFRGAIYRTLRTDKHGVEVQDRAFDLATQHFHHPKIPLVSLRSSKVAPVAYRSSQLQGTPRWRGMVQATPLDASLFPLHNPANYVSWLGTQKKRLVVLEDVADARRYGRGEDGGLHRSLRRETPSSALPGENQ